MTPLREVLVKKLLVSHSTVILTLITGKTQHLTKLQYTLFWLCFTLKLHFSKKKGYFEGIVGNLELMPKYYPGWVMRLYYDLNKKDPVLKDLCELACQHDYLDICDAKHLPGTPFKDASKVFAMNWRFFPTLDPQVIFL